MTEVREPGFSLDLPGEWVQAEGDEPGTFVYREEDGTGQVTVVVLGVRPVFAISDPKRLLDDYLKHRMTFELSKDASLIQSEPFSRKDVEPIEGGWGAVDDSAARRLMHRVLLAQSVLADFCYEAAGLNQTDYAKRAAAVLATAAIRVPPANQA